MNEEWWPSVFDVNSQLFTFHDVVLTRFLWTLNVEAKSFAWPKQTFLVMAVRAQSPSVAKSVFQSIILTSGIIQFSQFFITIMENIKDNVLQLWTLTGPL